MTTPTAKLTHMRTVRMRKRLIRTLLSEYEVADDLDMHVSKVEIAEFAMLEIREYVPSIGRYGRGVMIPLDQVSTHRRAVLIAERALKDGT